MIGALYEALDMLGEARFHGGGGNNFVMRDCCLGAGVKIPNYSHRVLLFRNIPLLFVARV